MADDPEIIDEDPEGEPDVTSTNPAVRKLARKLRIQRRLEALHKENLIVDDSQGVVEQEVKSSVQLQVERSAELLEKLIIDGEEHVTNVRIANEARETDRRERVGFGRDKVLEDLEKEAADAQDMFHEIADKWGEILKYNDPLHINDEIASQKEKCDELVKQKDAIIAMLKQELRTADINFTNDQRKQTEDINTLAKRIENQLIIMKKAYRRELEMVEDAIMSERQLMIETNNKKWDDLAKRRDQEETANSDKKFEELDVCAEDMKKLTLEFQERFRETKIKLENDCDMLQRELERIKTLALMNNEKLDYNYQILKKREDENIIIKSQQKRRMNKLRDILNGLRRKIDEYCKYGETKAEKLTSETRTLKKTILEIESKADRFAKVNDEKYRKIWKMNHDRAKELCRKILETDRVLHEHQLGIACNPPVTNNLNLNDLRSYKSALQILADDYGVREARSVTTITPGDEEKKAVPSLVKETPVYRRVLNHILKQLANKGEFLIEDQLKTIIQPYTDKEGTLVRIDNVFAALEVLDPEDIDLLLVFLLPYMYCHTCDAEKTQRKKEAENEEIEMQVHEVETDTEINKTDATGGETSRSSMMVAGLLPNLVQFGGSITIDDDLEGECRGPEIFEDNQTAIVESNSQDSLLREKVSCQYQHPLVISPVYILRGLREFLGVYHVPKEGVPTMGERLSRQRSTVSRLLSESDVALFWKTYTQVLSTEKQELWDSLLEGLKKYHALLKARRTVSEEVVCLRRQNAELRRLLSNYLDNQMML